jgi:hypothetical protein
MKSLACQSVAEMGGRLSVLHRQKRDHVRLDELLHRLAAASLPERERVLRKIYRLVFPHAFAEEAILWPVARRVLSDGPAITLRIEREHQEINDLVSRMERTSPGSPANGELLARVVVQLREDVRDEEDELLPRLQTALSPAKLRLLGVAWEAVRWIAPTRAHPVVSRRPPGNILSALPLAIVDRCRDVADALHELFSAVGLLRAISGKLEASSHVIERLPGTRAGEDPSTRRGKTHRK